MPGEFRGRSPSVDDSATSSGVSEAAFDGCSEEPPARCPYCDRPFRQDRYESLHRGLAHSERLTDRERATFERVRSEEYPAIRRVRLYALFVLVLLYFGLLILAAFVV
ncbi:DUF7410 domain-containing protein [Natrinema halophilum]|uniref:DUF7410 domain-containing protein n=1 Tax=Natrinema halophilum TaxID=1699371 RepID=UPI001F2E969A|nr:hypothetical protein [Natrinema halophilum]QLG51284.2 hypothetical protein HYG82_19135 [Natrinema halophilum]